MTHLVPARHLLAAAAVLAATGAPRLLRAASPTVCQQYATTAVQQQLENYNKSCGFAGDRWSFNRPGHYQWCLGVPAHVLAGETNAREQELARCRRCNDYAAEANRAQQENVNLGCGFQGDPWSFATWNHLSWCLSVPQTSADQQTDLRRAEIDRCRGCGRYAREAVAAQGENRQLGCGFSGDIWSDDEAAHFRWCVGNDPKRVEHDSAQRGYFLGECARCESYVREAIAAEEANQRGSCGLSGERWSARYEHHAAWCAGASPEERERESNARSALLAACTPAKVASCRAYARTATAQQEENLSLGCGLTGDSWSTHTHNHHAWCLLQSPSVYDGETAKRASALAACRQSLNQPAPSQCLVSVIARNKTCWNANLSPSQYLDPGSVSAIGCGPDEATAEANAKQMLASQMLLTDDEEPVANACSYALEAPVSGCLCAP